MSNFGWGFLDKPARTGRRLAVGAAMLIGCMGLPAAYADAVFGQGELAPLTPVFEQPQCVQQCETADWRIRSVSAPTGVGRLLGPSDALFLITGKLPNYCGASRCVEAYLLRDASSLRVLKSGYEISRTSPLTAGDIPPVNARGFLAGVPRAQANGWNQGKQSIARDILTAYSNDLEVINRVADNADYAVMAWAAYMDDAPDSMALARERGWTPFKSYVIENSTVGDTVAVLFISSGRPAVMAFRGTEGDGDGKTNTKGITSDDPKYTGQILGARTLALEVAAAQPNVIFVGHSLGGRLAQVAGMATGRPAVVFNSSPLGVHDKETARTVPTHALPTAIRFRSPNDPLSALFSPLDISVANIEVANLLTISNIRFAHNMGVMATAMQSVRAARDERWIASYLAGLAPQWVQPPTSAPSTQSTKCPQAGMPGDGQKSLADCVTLAMSNLASAVQDLNTARNEGRISGALGQAMSGVITRNPQAESMQLATCQQLAKAGANELSTAACLALVWSKNPKIRRESSDVLDRVLDDVNRRIASNRLPLTTVPATYIVQGGCPGEGCKFGMWTATGTRSMFEKPGSGTLVGQVTRGERVAALRSELRVRPVKGVVVGRIDHLKQGETVYLMDYVGEGHSNTWARGQVFADPRSNDGCTPTPACKSAINYPLEKAPYEWWVRIQKRDGQSGWIRPDLNPIFYGTSWVGSPSVTIPDPYDDQSTPTPSGPQNPSNLARTP